MDILSQTNTLCINRAADRAIAGFSQSPLGPGRTRIDQANTADYTGQTSPFFSVLIFLFRLLQSEIVGGPDEEQLGLGREAR